MDDTEWGKGLIHIYTGDGKGKTTAALGLALRAAGQGLRVIMIQFVKGDPDCGEHLFASKHHVFNIVQLTKGNSFTMPQEELRAAARETLAYAEEVLIGRKYEMIVLDEIFTAIDKGLLDTSEVVELVERKPESVELILTGRNAPPEIIKIADLVTEMRMIKHPLAEGIPARRGIDY